VNRRSNCTMMVFIRSSACSVAKESRASFRYRVGKRGTPWRLVRKDAYTSYRNDTNLVQRSIVLTLSLSLAIVLLSSATCHLPVVRRQRQQSMTMPVGHPDSMQVWSHFVSNMAPVIERVVTFSKSLPGNSFILLLAVDFETACMWWSCLFGMAAVNNNCR